MMNFNEIQRHKKLVFAAMILLCFSVFNFMPLLKEINRASDLKITEKRVQEKPMNFRYDFVNALLPICHDLADWAKRLE